MVTILLSGGLGNQLFQYAFGRSCAMHHRTQLVLDIRKLSSNSTSITKRNYELDFFSNPSLIKNSSNKFRYSTILSSASLSNLLKINYYLKEKNGKFDYNFLNYSPRLIADGYWQSFKYFHSISGLIVRDLDSHKPLSHLSKKILYLISSLAGSVSIHVRRGDYIENTIASKFHGVLPLDYYNKLISQFSFQIDSPHFFIFSDDPLWCQDNLNINTSNVTYVTHNLGVDSWQDLILMSYCRHHIIANSSFSWWGAWLADHRFGTNRLVAAPKKWFLESDFYPGDRFPGHWVLS